MHALLKSLEEPKPGNSFVITAPQRERMLPTLVSRSCVLTLPWPPADEFCQLTDEELAIVTEWGRGLLKFAQSGREWMDKTSRRGSMDARLAMQLVLFCQNALAQSLAEREGLTPLAAAFGQLSPQNQRILNETLAECQDSLIFTANPSLVVDWLATRLFFLFAKERAM